MKTKVLVVMAALCWIPSALAFQFDSTFTCYKADCSDVDSQLQLKLSNKCQLSFGGPQAEVISTELSPFKSFEVFPGTGAYQVSQHVKAYYVCTPLSKSNTCDHSYALSGQLNTAISKSKDLKERSLYAAKLNQVDADKAQRCKDVVLPPQVVPTAPQGFVQR